MIGWLKVLKVGKTERYSVDVTNFADGQTITSASFVSTGGLSTIGTTAIDGTIISALFTGVNVGTDFIDIEYSTATRSDCLKPQLVIKDC
jgi:hypothetical protein